MKKGEATGPQKQPKRGGGPVAPPAEPEVNRADDAQRARNTWDKVGARIAEECDRMAFAMAEFPASADLRSSAELPLKEFMQVERKVTELRVELEQLLGMVG